MSLALTDEHRALADVVASFLADQKTLALSRAVLDHNKGADDIGPLWRGLAKLGWLGLHLPSEFGGDDAGLPELAVVAEQLGRVVVPVPFVSTVVASELLNHAGSDDAKQRLLPGFVDGTNIGGIGLGGSLALGADGTVAGESGYVIGGKVATVLALRAGDDVVLVAADAPGVTVEKVRAMDPTQHIAKFTLSGVTPEAVLSGAAVRARRLARVLGAADAAGGARATMEMAVEYAKVRQQFGRIIGSFQAIKHHAANMLVAAELAVGAAWDAARAGVDDEQGVLASDVAATVAFESYVTNAEMNIQIHGGIGFTWEHDCHLFLRRAQSLRGLLADGEAARDELIAISRSGVQRQYAVDLPPEAEDYRRDAAEVVAKYNALPEADRRLHLVDTGYLVPHWPAPFGRGASPVEQLVIEEEFAGVEVPKLGIAGWVMLTLSQHGDPAQIERWIRPGLLGELVFCQLFSEPGAGSDAAAVSTKGVKVDGGWRVTGQKVWTSDAMACNRGLATIRTNKDAPKHLGITTMVIDLKAEGVTIRPLKQISGDSNFNEIFFDDVFVPDEDVVGAIDAGWTVARATLGNERISIGGGQVMLSATHLLAMLEGETGKDRAATRAVADLIGTEQAMRMLNLRQVARAVAGAGPGPEGNVTKLVSSEHMQNITELFMRLGGEGAVTGELPAAQLMYLGSRAITIAGGTSEINRNVIAERLLGLPREQIAN
ncbi:acyl-CoA dehydrogenase [Aldersonia kunmingensis]|uniref:acyl-CoA dehydrogenase n=1 Tax=Aldersonia kunmingensis TaxID=408066 RepID=UPI000836DE1C|nr:acyl-CoA dehydrogenase [Aldersonia kunmingensis]